MPRSDYDGPWKEVLEYFFRPFVELCMPQAAADIDWSRGYESLDKELNKILRGNKNKRRTTDKLFKVWRYGGEELWVLIHIEVQAQKDVDFPERMYVSNYRLFDRHHKPIVSVAILADDNPNWRPQCYGRELWHNKLMFEFTVIKLLDFAQPNNGLLIQETNPFSLVIWTHLQTLHTRKNPQQRLNSKIAITRALYGRGFSKDYVMKLFRFIDWIMVLPEPLELGYNESVLHFEKEKHMTYITTPERISMKKGWQKGGCALLSRQLKYRFGVLPKTYRQRLETSSEKRLLQICERLLDAKTLEDVFADETVSV